MSFLHKTMKVSDFCMSKRRRRRRRSRGNRRSRRSKYSKSLGYQMHERMQKMNRIGQSRHEAKKESVDGKTDGIHSKSTYDNYKQVSVQFVRWLQEKHK